MGQTLFSALGARGALVVAVSAVGLLGAAAAGQPSVVISQAYGGGGQNASFPNVDYVELFNRGNQVQSLAGWSVQVSQGSDSAGWTVIPLSGVLQPGQYYLVQVYTPASATGVAIPTPDAVGSSPSAALLFSGDGRVALVSATTALTNPPCPATASGVVDFVAWGAPYTCVEGGTPAAPATTVTTAATRGGAGCNDTNINSADFTAAAPAPRNRRSNAFVSPSATPSSFPQGEVDVVVLVSRSTAAPCHTQLGPIVDATVDLSAIGGQAGLPLLDDGGDDGGAGDGVWGVTVGFAATLSPGEYVLPVTVRDGVRSVTAPAVVTVRVGPPANDLCAGAIDLGLLASPGAFIVDNSAAAADVDVGTCNTGTMTQFGVWYTFTAPSAGAVFMRETGPQDAVFGVFTGTCEMPTPVTPTSCFSLDDPSAFAVAAGTTYRILVGNQSSSTTPPTAPLNLTFSFSPRPGNDICDTATDLGSLTTPYMASVDNAGAGDDLDVTCNSATATRFGVWYAFTAPASGALLLNETSTQDAVYGVFTGECGAPAPLAPTSCFSTDTNTIVPVTAGTRYLLLVGNQGSSATPPAVPFNLTVTFAPTPSNDACAEARAVAAFPFIDTPFAPNAGDDVDVACNAAGNTMTRKGVWYQITTGVDGGRLVPQEGSANDVVFGLFTGACDAPVAAGCLNESGAAAGFTLAPASSYRLLVGLNSATINPTLPYAITLNFTPDTGACCTPEGCQVLSASACAGAAGVFRGVNTPCTDVPRYFNGASAPIPDYSGPAPAPGQPLVSTITAPAADTATITTLAVRLTLSHAAAGDLAIRLTGPDNTAADLMVRAGVASPCALGISGSSSDLNGTYILSDAGATTWAAAVAAGPAVLPPGTYRASGCGDAAVALNALFAGRPVAGAWTLSITDEDEGLTGGLTSWGLIVNGADAPCPSGACCVQLACSVASEAECSRLGGAFTSGAACGPQTCVPPTGACCDGSSCRVASQAECTGPNTAYAGPGTVCNAFGVNNTTPCCLGDFNHIGNVSVQDIFDFLTAYFGSQPAADVNGVGGVTVQDIFDYLSLYFAGPC